MNNDLDDWLNSLGIESTPSTQETTAIAPAQSVAELHPQEQLTSNISPNDFNDILAENGFQEPVYEEAEEVTDEDEEEDYNENGSEGRDLDAEEDEDWNRLQEAGVITPEEYTWTVRPSIQTEAIDAVQSVNEDDYPEHNPDEETVHMSIGDGSADVPVIHEQVSDDAMEAFNSIADSQPPVCSQILPERPPVIPPNSPTLLLNDATSRFSGTEWYSSIQKAKIILAGLGGIGRI